MHARTADEVATNSELLVEIEEEEVKETEGTEISISLNVCSTATASPTSSSLSVTTFIASAVVLPDTHKRTPWINSRRRYLTDITLHLHISGTISATGSAMIPTPAIPNFQWGSDDGG
jgi:hypothetical protein